MPKRRPCPEKCEPLWTILERRDGMDNLIRNPPALPSLHPSSHHKFIARGLPALAGRGIAIPFLFNLFSVGCIMRLMPDRYARNAGAVFSLKYHLVWCPKFRREVLTGKIDARLRVIIADVAAEHRMTIHALEIMPDHVHLFVESDPTLCVAEIVNRFKGRSSHDLRAEFPKLRSRLPTLWSRSYFAGTVGSVTDTAVKKYIEGQKGK